MVAEDVMVIEESRMLFEEVIKEDILLCAVPVKGDSDS